jgi:CcmD family protein
MKAKITTFGPAKSSRMKKYYIALTTILLFLSQMIFAQNSGGNDFLRSTGKIYVVVAVIVAVFLGIIAFLIYLDRRLTKLEDQIQDQNE